MQIRNSTAASDVTHCGTDTEADCRCGFPQICRRSPSRSSYLLHCPKERRRRRRPFWLGLSKALLYVQYKSALFIRFFLLSIQAEVRPSQDSTQRRKLQLHKHKCAHMLCVCVCLLWGISFQLVIYLFQITIVYTEIHSARVGNYKRKRRF